jgi:uncharacterized membrane protein
MTNEQAGLRRATLAGVVAGLRSQAQLAMLARSIDDGETAPPSGPLGRLFGSPQARRAIQVAAVGETIVDKLPFTPSRLKPGPFLGRLGFGALSAAALAQTQQTPVVPAAIRGVGGAAIGSVGGYLFRTVIGKATGLPNLVVALAEDAIAIGLARSAIRPESLAELAAEQDGPSPTLATSAPPPAPPTADTPAAPPPGDGDPGTEDPTAPIPSA